MRFVELNNAFFCVGRVGVINQFCYKSSLLVKIAVALFLQLYVILQEFKKIFQKVFLLDISLIDITIFNPENIIIID